MSEDELQREVLDQVGLDRRTFVKRLLVGTAFAVPVIASFPLSAMGHGDATCANQPPERTLGQWVSGEQPQLGGEAGTILGAEARDGDPPGKCFAPGQRR